MHIREYKPDQSFRGSIDTMDEIEDFKTYVAEYFSWKVPRHGDAVFTDVDDAEGLSRLRRELDEPDGRTRAPETARVIAELFKQETEDTRQEAGEKWKLPRH